MFPVVPGSSVPYVPPPPPAPPPYKVQPHDTVQSIAQSYSVTPEELARANGIATTATLTPGQTLILPDNAVPPPPKEQLPCHQSLEQKTNTAISTYQAALKEQQQAMQNAPRNAGLRSELAADEANTVDTAQQAMNTAIQNEIAGEIANRNNGVPAQFRTPTDQLITSFGQAIVQRYQGDPTTQAAISTCVSNYQLQTKADALISAVPSNGSAQQKLQSLSTQLQGQSQDVINQVLSDSNVQSWIQAEANQVAQPYAQVQPNDVYFAADQANQAANQLQTVTTGLSPVLATAVTQASMPTIQKMAQLELGSVGNMVPFDTLQSVLANLGGSDQANAVVQQVADAYADNFGTAFFLTRGGGASELENSVIEAPGYGAAGSPNFAIALGNALQDRGQTTEANAAFDAGAQGVQDYLAHSDASPLKAFDAAQSAVDQKNEELSQLLKQSGPMTDAQQQAFIKAYQNDPDNAQAYKAEFTAAQTLATYMQNNQTSLIFAAGRNPSAAQQLYNAMQGLADSGQGKVALQFAGYVQNDAAASKAFSKFSDYEGTFLPDAVEAAEGQLLVENKGDPKSTADQLLELADPVFKGHAGWNQVKEGFEALAEGKTSTTPFNATAFAHAYKEMGVSGKVWAAAGVAVDSLNGANADQLNEMINSFSMAGGDVSEVGTGVLKVFADAGKFGGYTTTAEEMTNLGARFVPALGVVASTTAFASDLEAARDNANSAEGAFYTLATFGDLVSVIGSVMENIPVVGLAGEVVTGIGTILSAPFELAGHILNEGKEQKEFQDEQVKYLKDAGFNDNQAELMAKDGSAINAFAQQVGLNPTQAQQILMAHPEAFNEGSSYTQGVIDLVKACQIQPADASGFLTALAKDNPNYLNTFYNQRLETDTDPNMPLVYNAHLVDLIGGSGYANTKAYVQAHAPNVFSADGTSRRQADSDYGSALLNGTLTPMPLQVTQYLQNNSDNTVYQTEIISLMKNNGSLNNWVKQMSSNYDYNGWPDVAKTAIQNAQSAGVLTAAQAQQYIAEIG